MEAFVPDFQVDFTILQPILALSASFLFSKIRSRKDKFVTHEYVWAVLLFNSSLLIPSELLITRASTKSQSWIFSCMAYAGLFYYSFIPAFLIGSVGYQAKALLGEYQKSSGRLSAFRLFVLIHTAFTAGMRIKTLVNHSN